MNKLTPENEELKPCPFCNSSVMLVSEPVIDGKASTAVNFYHYICCDTQGCSDVFFVSSNKDRTISKWNTRA